MNGLTLIEILIVGYWYLLDNWSYVTFMYYTKQVGMLPKYAFKKVQGKL